jgi:uncharacterized membrane protein (UPF0127 family)
VSGSGNGGSDNGELSRRGNSLVAVRARNVTRDTILATDVEQATSFLARFLGLMGRAGLPEGHGLWLPDDGIHMFFMRFPIDAVFLGQRGPDGTRPIVALHADLAPWRGIVPLVRGASGLLELPAGTIRATRAEVGDLVSVA